MVSDDRQHDRTGDGEPAHRGTCRRNQPPASGDQPDHHDDHAEDDVLRLGRGDRLVGQRPVLLGRTLRLGRDVRGGAGRDDHGVADAAELGRAFRDGVVVGRDRVSSWSSVVTSETPPMNRNTNPASIAITVAAMTVRGGLSGWPSSGGSSRGVMAARNDSKIPGRLRASPDAETHDTEPTGPFRRDRFQPGRRPCVGQRWTR